VPARLIEDALAFLGGLDALVLNAGAPRPGNLVDLSIGDWDFVFAIHTRAPWLLAQAAYPALRESKGTIVATGSVSGTAPAPGLGAYAPSKAALIMLCQMLALEWGSDNINVNVVSPGFVVTPMTSQVYADEKLAERRKAAVPIGRFASPDEIAATICFLLSSDARYITGADILVDGGLTRSSLMPTARFRPSNRA
jgi:glucose 1-dehydrogenase